MEIWEKINNTLCTLKQAFKASWASANAAPISFSHMSESEQAILAPIHANFEDKASRGYFDDDVIRDYKKFLYRAGFEKPEVESAALYMQQVAQRALPENRRHAKAVQDMFWKETGLRDTRQLPDISFNE
jgi:hypothetical protein